MDGSAEVMPESGHKTKSSVKACSQYHSTTDQLETGQGQERRSSMVQSQGVGCKAR